MNTIDFREIEKSIELRSKQVQDLQKELWRCVTLDGSFRFVVDEHFKPEALEIIKKTNKLNKQNAYEINLMTKARELAAKYKLPIDHSGHVRDNPEKLDLMRIELDAQRQLVQLEYQKKQAILNSEYSGDLEQKIEKLIFENKQIIEAVKITRNVLTEMG